MDCHGWNGDPLLAAFAAVQSGGIRMLIRKDCRQHAELLGLGGSVPIAGATVEGGRQPHPVVELPGGERAVMRSYRRGGAMRHLNRERYFLGHRAFDELRATEQARRGGVRVPTVLAASEHRRAIGYTATLATLWIPRARDGAAWLPDAAPAARMAMLGEAGRQIGRMHDAGVAHPDLNLRNLLIGERGRRNDPCETEDQGAQNDEPDGLGNRSGPLVYLLDFDRARVFAGPVPPARRARDLRRLARSARKLDAPVGAGGWRALRAGYGSRWPLPDLG